MKFSKMRWSATISMVMAFQGQTLKADVPSFSYCQNGSCEIVEDIKAFRSKPIASVNGGTFVRFKGAHFHCQANDQYALTFDDGPSHLAPKVLDILRTYKIPATFFVLGNHLQSTQQKSLLQRAFQEGHMIANHTMSHPSLISLSPEQALEQLDQTRAVIQDILGPFGYSGEESYFYRPPYGEIDDTVGETLRDAGYTAVIWNSDRYDWQDIGSVRVIDRLNQHLDLQESSRLGNRSILDLNHDRSSSTLGALETLIKNVRSAGYRFVSVRDCIDSRS
ncbi:polysaccharide deacetylase family protein [Pseudobacteriovorax antillogorgiicola]|uniref:Peptidoglycan/xylan/chitin deacetylase, PgdA/CDA1 family n=1 Tax=Pseudobacteriovorax antillogorgiicola TaxID=1513793 RepID=A0A1Y6C1D0_9BACT|nr:polysaccharide deacetylase family protein [Pseudobacteriovorax antillogorgiicola]TCS52441.1 peptidoglycan/xylan/chitin deacetylase (PgdA/CDA1 family) [Pseudobacteriovorax antillogorgiicola]SMF28630.1 Peptidoglycan/xylan/chitin deacetylase, PgdA/CDA1 family [Pseudobacteriovorax antillogorgiicola]